MHQRNNQGLLGRGDPCCIAHDPNVAEPHLYSGEENGSSAMPGSFLV